MTRTLFKGWPDLRKSLHKFFFLRFRRQILLMGANEPLQNFWGELEGISVSMLLIFWVGVS